MAHKLDDELEEKMVHELCEKLEDECEKFRTKYIELDGCKNCASIHAVNSLAAVIVSNLHPSDLSHVIGLLQEAADDAYEKTVNH